MSDSMESAENSSVECSSSSSNELGWWRGRDVTNSEADAEVEARADAAKSSSSLSDKNSESSTDRNSECIMCHEAVLEKDKGYRPCNCMFGFVHPACIQRCLQRNLTTCQACLNKYNVIQKHEICTVCFGKCEEKLEVCGCMHNYIHENCLSRQYLRGTKVCSFCNKQYSVRVRESYQFDSSVLLAFCKKIGKIFLTLLYNAYFLFLIAPYDWLSLFDPSFNLPRYELKAGVINLLFPGSKMETAIWVDILYSCGLFLALIYSLFAIFQVWKWRSFNVRKIDILIDFGLLFLLHMFGNIHMQFWCGVGVIPSQNCFFALTWQTAFDGVISYVVFTTGALFIISCTALPFYLIFLVAKKCFTTQKTVIIMPIELNSV